MDTVYSVSLLISLTAGALSGLFGVGLLLPVATVWLPTPLRSPARLNVAIATAVAVSVTALFLSLAVHLVFGHRPGSPQELPLAEFFAIHPAYIFSAALPLVAVALRWFGLRRRSQEVSE